MPSPVLSPCIGVCEVSESGLCLGCLRSLQEIGQWLSYSDAQRQYLMEIVLPAREINA